MRSRLVVSCGLLIAAIAFVTWWKMFRPAPRISGPLRHEVYVWQRVWTESVRNAVGQHGTHFSSLCVLKAEVSWKERRQVARVRLHYPSLRVNRLPVGIAIRIGTYDGNFRPHDTNTLFLTDLVLSLVAESRSNHLNLSELQIDFDCPESKLENYRNWIEHIQRRVSPLPLTITALPSWLDSHAFKKLAAVATNYVLQVHSVERPRDIRSPLILCPPRAAASAIERAGRIGVPFRVALPTYGYLAAFDQTGKFIGLSAEGPRPNWPTNAQLREVRSNPAELGDLARRLTTSRPAAMRGIIWYRLPVSTDNYNWRWPTLHHILVSSSQPNR